MVIDNRKFGLLAGTFAGQMLPLKVLRSAAGWYLGTVAPSGEPFSRESEGYYGTANEAERALVGGNWDQRRRL